MNSLLADNDTALRMFFTDLIFLPSGSETDSEQNEPEMVQFSFVGGNEKKVLVLVNDPDHPVSTPEGAELLRNILKFLQLKTVDFALVNFAQHTDASFRDLEQFFEPVVFISFGVDPGLLQLPVSFNEPLSAGVTKILLTTGLHEMSTNSASKRAFFHALKAVI